MAVQRLQPGGTPGQPVPTGGISLNPETFEAGGGLLDDVTLTFDDVAFVMWDYGKAGEMFPFLQAVVTDEAGKSYDQYWKCGDPKQFVPSADNESLIPIGTKKGLHGSTNAGALIASLVAAGFPAAKLNDGKISVLKGLVVHMHREAQNRGMKDMVTAGEQKRDDKCLVVDKIIKYPWDAAPLPSATTGIRRAPGAATAQAAPTGGAPPTPAARPAAATASDALANRAAEAIITVLGANGGTITKAALSPALFNSIPATDPLRGPVLAKAFDDTFLATGGPWKYVNGVLSF